jgi:hypothetical protein
MRMTTEPSKDPQAIIDEILNTAMDLDDDTLLRVLADVHGQLIGLIRTRMKAR